MPRRGFFRGGGSSGDKKISKKQYKLQQKQAQQEQQILRQQQEHQQKRLSSSSSNNNNESEPPLGLHGPRQTAPSQIRAYEPRVTGIQYQPRKSSPSPQHNSVSPAGTTSIASDANQILLAHQIEEQQLIYQQQQQQVQNLSPAYINQPTHPNQQYLNQQHYEEVLQEHGHINQQFVQQQIQQQQIVQQQQQQQQQTTPPFSSQAEIQQQQYPAQQNILAAQNQHISPTVDDAVAEIWRLETDDFRSASHAIQILRLSIVAEWERQQVLDANTPKHRKTFSYDPSDTFLSLQGATLRFHARFEAMKVERDTYPRGSASQQRHIGDASVADSTTVNTHATSLNGVEWELTEQAAWEVWEESVRASAALTHACVGPAWRLQLKLRRQLIRETEMRLLMLDMRRQSRVFPDNMSLASSMEGSMTSSILSMDISNPQSSGRPLMTGQESVMTEPPPAFQPHADILDMIPFAIPEVLPAAMIRFTASVIETSIPPVRTADTKIYWDSPGKIGVGNPVAGEILLNKVGNYIQDERRWLRRRKRLGDTQR